MDSCEGSLQTISWKTISWYQYKHNCRWQMTSWSSHRRWEVSGRILQREESRMEKRIRSTSKNNIIRTSNSLLCFFTGDKHKVTYFRLCNQTNEQIYSSNWWRDTVETHTSHYRWTYLFRSRAHAAIPAMSLPRSGYSYPERNCSIEIEHSVKTTKALSNQIAGRQYKAAESQSIKDTKKGNNCIE